MIEAWEAKLAGDTQDAAQMFEAARELAAKRGMRFLSYDKVARLRSLRRLVHEPILLPKISTERRLSGQLVQQSLSERPNSGARANINYSPSARHPSYRFEKPRDANAVRQQS
ncbi:hypothetical protein GQF56_15160 [Rhodobacter sphaeroides]|jgi:hypothetical protein|uniref:hypothetical protein n=1 Tax=Cereibacter sphaeroides TaxID=1063 RepID=UPI000A457C1E|nr:hypothetical protein [Cereibacter sphaeroides]MVX46278.1 hypothetical protein [Cereibacter sphaeroides]MVX49196.1 hypothetical protein [Cereibacter sphaeroides]QHA11687.1 hypothetical protein GQR99_15875 [Cereibacter sphaeroides]QHA14610.1 hypothetical protein GQY06_15845 [Cereibacter sphaeroides]QJC85674.1 hypothetical protein HGN32_15690 [Cereibacter sphaeroides]